MERFRNRGFAEKAAAFMKWVTILTMAFMALFLVLSIAGRESFSLRTPEGSWDDAIWSEESHDYETRGITVSSKDDIYVVTKDKSIPLSVRIAISAMSAVTVIPAIAALYFLSNVFSNVSKGRIFTEDNSRGLFLYGAIKFTAAIVCPFLKLGICAIATAVGSARIDIATGSGLLSDLIPAIGFMIASYIIRHGLSLQDEVDHTI